MLSILSYCYQTTDDEDTYGLKLFIMEGLPSAPIPTHFQVTIIIIYYILVIIFYMATDNTMCIFL